MTYKDLNPDKALIWRITHRDNLPWILENGLHAANSPIHSNSWEIIGNIDLINKRATRQVPISPGGYLNDYIPFYFTPFSPMLYNIHTGRGGVRKVENSKIIILVSSLYHLHSLGLPFVFTDRHAYSITANYFNKLDSLNAINWPLLQVRNFQRDPNDPEKIERYQAEALIPKKLPVEGLLGVVCYTESTQQTVQKHVEDPGIPLKVICRPNWFF
ncbi:type II toxin-antitoxin system toxin DNA ADP-ribosyl transferase DarT [Marinospirillum insulare]|uniref:DarT domain-containing protein n=1 Tax=Marinospirillum insulare TaxID=217169 RepID=A0ABQ6A4C5_9GAMM|nr:DUF4433 domain-containing protein [Marinospirillum insulare]GLR64964.1 hypothetical protein GCM10007878_24020 [Marinospirillum insulare]